MGCIYRRGKIWWLKYYKNGKPYCESSRTDCKEAAGRLLKRREGEIAKGELPGIYFDRVRFEELAEDFLTDYKVNGRKSLDKAERSVRNLSEAFGGMRIPQITTARIKAYVARRLEAGLSSATINRELAALKRMFHLGQQSTPPKVAQVPYVPMLKERNARKGFFEHGEFLALREALPEYLKPVVSFAYYTGWRLREILGLTWPKVDLKAGTVRLDPGESKNEEARTLYLNEELAEALRGLQARRRLGCPYVFHREGKRIKDPRGAWESACKAAGLWGFDEKKGRNAPTRIFHDFRRTAVRNLVRAGVPERVAMAISGHKTRAVFERYNIVSGEDLKEAARKQAAYLQSFSPDGYKTVTVGKKWPLSPRGRSIQLADLIGAGGRSRTDMDQRSAGF